MSKTVKNITTVKRSRPALTPEARENQLIAKAMNVAEQQLDNGTASSQIICHYLKLGTVKAQLELERERKEIELIKAKASAMASNERIEKLYAEALNAMKLYAGAGGEVREEEFDDYDSEY